MHRLCALLNVLFDSCYFFRFVSFIRSFVLFGGSALLLFHFRISVIYFGRRMFFQASRSLSLSNEPLGIRCNSLFITKNLEPIKSTAHSFFLCTKLTFHQHFSTDRFNISYRSELMENISHCFIHNFNILIASYDMYADRMTFHSTLLENTIRILFYSLI